jgi:hypothetical protein
MENEDVAPPIRIVEDSAAIRERILDLLEQRSRKSYLVGLSIGFLMGSLVTTLIFRKQ